MRPLIVALDLETDREALELVKHLRVNVDLFKVGPVLFMKYGPALIQSIHALGAKVFLDLKLHDIPSVVAKGVKRAGELGVYSLTLHASGGEEMMKRSAKVARRPKLWGVTVLTSMDALGLQGIGIRQSPLEQVRRLAALARSSGLNGVVASVEETPTLRKELGPNFEIITPGIRLAAGGDDQKRVATPADAVKAGSTFFVMGRPVLEAKDPVKFVKGIYDSLK